MRVTFLNRSRGYVNLIGQIRGKDDWLLALKVSLKNQTSFIHYMFKAHKRNAIS